jgi:hypothetical protein
MSTRNLFILIKKKKETWAKGRLARKADNFAAIY